MGSGLQVRQLFDFGCLPAVSGLVQGDPGFSNVILVVVLVRVALSFLLRMYQV